MSHRVPTVAMDSYSDDGRVVVRFRGVLDRSTAPLLRRQLLETARRATGELVVDLAETSFLDCRGIALLAEARDVVPQGHRLRLSGARGVVHRALTISDLRGSMIRRCACDHHSLRDEIRYMGAGGDPRADDSTLSIMLRASSATSTSASTS